jgi:hypothetical protein
MEITIEHKPEPAPRVTGAALRNIQLADAQADQVLGALRSAAARLSDALNQTDVNATTLAEGWSALASWTVAKNVVSDLCDRHKSGIRIDVYHTWPISGLTSIHSPESALKKASEQYVHSLRQSGVPMEDTGLHTISYWRDAQARGC